MKRILSVIILCALVLSTLSSCGGSDTTAEVKAFDKSAVSEKPTEKTVAQNSKYTLEFDSETCGVTLTDRQSGRVWGTSPPDTGKVRLDKWGDPITRHPRVSSVLSVEYVSAETGNTESVISKTGAVKDGRIVCRTLENGIRIEYYFDSPGFMIPVDYILREDSLLATINPADIEESENVITSISLTPFFCAAENELSAVGRVCVC